MPRIIDVVEWADQGPNDIVQREPEKGAGDIRLGSQLVVRTGQAAVFFRDGKALDLFREGRHTLSTMNLPILSSIIGLATSGKTPFPAEIYFVALKDFINQKWGTPTEITVRDNVLGMVQLRSFGTYAWAIDDAQQFITQIVGAQGLYSTGAINDYLRSILVTDIASVLGQVMKSKSLLDLAELQSDLGAAIVAKASEDFTAMGLKLKKLNVESIQPSDETAKAIGQRSAMGALGVNYTTYQAGQAMRDAATSGGGGGIAAVGAGLGAGAGIGQMMGGAIADGMRQAGPPPVPSADSAAGAVGAVAGAAAGAMAASAPTTKAEIQAALTKLDVRVANGEISEALYNKLAANLQKALEDAKE
ncbi:MAG TPA: SPFH domain-containing protein [Thermoflexales bacterium]|nr:SPFH domain-containing protein [Thermoflexales bacterium]HQZ21518.1 SPFH domain-containing protein [Thermoflexales bacterium]HQZ99521.1 SPFH domain-containing protein [Thermoflexales bacterium]